MNVIQLVILTLCASLLYGCSSSPTEQIAERRAELKEQKQESMQDALEEYPDWYHQSQALDVSQLDSKTTASSHDPQTAYDKALLLAQGDLAAKINNQVSALSKLYNAEGTTNNNSTYGAVIESLVNKTSVIGYDEVKKHLMVEDGKYRAFVWLTWDLEKALKIQSQNASVTESIRQTSREMFEELESRIN